MGVIIQMTSSEFKKKFINFVDPRQYSFIVLSEEIKTKEKDHNNVKVMTGLIPSVDVLRFHINNDMEGYREAYLKFLKHPQKDILVWSLVKAAVEDDINIVLICSDSEHEYKYIDMICKYIQTVYGFKTWEVKKFMKDPEKTLKIKGKEKIQKILKEKHKELMKANKVKMVAKSDKKKFEKQLGDLSPKELLEFAKSKRIKLDKKLKQKEMVKILSKKLVG